MLDTFAKNLDRNIIESIKQDLLTHLLSEIDATFQLSVDSELVKQREKLKHSFYEFFRYFWPMVVQEKLIENWHLKFLCDEIQKVAERVFRREKKQYDLIINIPPGSTKSTIVSIMFPAWAWTRDPSLKFITGSYSGDLSLEHAVATRDLILCDEYKRLFPYININKDQNTKSNYKLTTGGQRFATSTGGTVTGMHAHIIIVDDPLNPKQASSDAELKTANDWLTKTLSTRKVDKMLTPTILIMQRLHDNDCTGCLLEKVGRKKHDLYKHICLPCDDSWPISPEEVKSFYRENGGLLDPKRLDRSVLEEARLTLGSFAFAGQFGQQPVPEEGGIFKKDWLVYYETLPERFERIVQSWDTAFKTGETNDYSVCTVWGETRRKKYYLLEVVRGRWEFAELEERVKASYFKWRPVAVLIEDKASGQSVIQNLRYRTKIPIIPIKTSQKSKEARASAVSPLFEAGRVLLPKDAPWLSEYISELVKFPRARHDDQVDSTTQFLNWAQSNTITAGRDLS